MCQTILETGDVFAVIGDPTIRAECKAPYARFLLWVYLNTSKHMPQSAG